MQIEIQFWRLCRIALFSSFFFSILLNQFITYRYYVKKKAKNNETGWTSKANGKKIE